LIIIVKTFGGRKMSEQEVLDEIKRIEKYVENCTSEEAREIMRDAGVVNPDGTLTDRYK
jgi:hypothetical protein